MTSFVHVQVTQINHKTPDVQKKEAMTLTSTRNGTEYIQDISFKLQRNINPTKLILQSKFVCLSMVVDIFGLGSGARLAEFSHEE